MHYWITRGAAVRSGVIDVNVAEEIRAGRIEGYSIYRTDQVIIGEDTLRRAELIADQLTVIPK